MLGVAVVVFSCQKEGGEEVVVEEVEQQSGGRAGFRERFIFYVAWEGHRPKTDCKTGFGICNVVSCFNCCVVNSNIINCDDDPDAQVVNNAGTITEENGIYTLTFLLNPDNIDHQSAIANQSVFYVDNDFLVDGYTIKEGEYSYDNTIGTHGGYLVNVE